MADAGPPPGGGVFTAASSVDAVWQQCGEWIQARHPSLVVNSQRHFVVTEFAPAAFLLGVEESAVGVQIDAHCPFLVNVPYGADLFEVVALNVGLTDLGYVRIFPMDEQSTLYGLEVRHVSAAVDLGEARLQWIQSELVASATHLYGEFSAAFGGSPAA
jgi:hypothetical protein